MKRYSNSKLTTFDNCKLQYKYKYIDKKEPSVPETIETFLGDKVHRTLEKLYQDLKYEKDVTKEELLQHYDTIWEDEWKDDIKIVKDYKAQHYKKKGQRMISDYYDHKKPFTDLNTIGLETETYYHLNEEYKVHVRIDRLESPEDGVYEIHDYKTSNTLMTEEEAQNDLQLRIYALGVLDQYQDAETIKLVWHFLEFNKEVVSEFNVNNVKHIENQIKDQIKEIETETDYDPTLSPLCDYCEYQNICPLWRHKFSDDISKEKGNELVEKYFKLKEKEDILNKKLDKLKDLIFEYADQHEIKALHTEDKRLNLWEKDVITFDDTHKEEIEQILEQLGLTEYIEVNLWKLQKNFDELSPQQKQVLKEFGTQETIRRVYRN